MHVVLCLLQVFQVELCLLLAIEHHGPDREQNCQGIECYRDDEGVLGGAGLLTIVDLDSYQRNVEHAAEVAQRLSYGELLVAFHNVLQLGISSLVNLYW